MKLFNKSWAFAFCFFTIGILIGGCGLDSSDELQAAGKDLEGNPPNIIVMYSDDHTPSHWILSGSVGLRT